MAGVVARGDFGEVHGDDFEVDHKSGVAVLMVVVRARDSIRRRHVHFEIQAAVAAGDPLLLVTLVSLAD